MTDFYVAKRKGWNHGLIAACVFCLMVWAGVILLAINAIQWWQAIVEFLEKVGLGI